MHFQISQNFIVHLKDQQSDEILMEAYRNGEIQAFDILFMRFKDALYRYLLRQIGNSAIAEEIFQDTWVALIKHRASYQVKSRFKTYLFHIAHNKVIDYYRKQRRNSTELISYEDEPDNIVSTLHNGPEDYADISKKHDYLLYLLNKLPAAQRDVFLMHEESGMTLVEIAEIMNVSRDTIKSRLRYAVQSLRQGMGRYK